MSLTRPRSIGIVATLVASSLALGAPASAAESPEAAVQAFFDMASSGDFSDIDDVVCAADRGAIREAFDFGAQLGIEDDASIADALSFEIADRSVEVISEEGDTATVLARATMIMSVPDGQVDDIVRAVLESERAADDPPVTDEDVEMMAGFMGSALNQAQAIDEEVTVTREDGEWRVCGGLVDRREPTVEVSVSSDGLCGIATPAELSEVGTLAYDSSFGFIPTCTYSTSDFERFHSASISLLVDTELERLAAAFGADQEVEAAGMPALATSIDSFGNQLLVDVGEDLLQVSVAVDGDTGVDWLAEATAITELLVPRIPSIREEITGPAPEPTLQPTPEISLCEGLTVEDLNEETGLGIDDAAGDRYYCGYNQLDGEPGWHTLSLSLSELALDDYRTWLPDAEDTSVAGHAGLFQDGQLIVELPGGAWTLLVAGWVDTNDSSISMSTEELLRWVAETVVPGVAVPEATASSIDVLDVEPGSATDVDAGPSLCDYIDLDAVNALGLIEFDEAFGSGATSCSISRTDFEQGFATLGISADVGDFDGLRAFYPEAQDLIIAGQSGFLSGSELYVDTSIGTLSVFALLPDDPDTAAGDVLIPIMELIVAAIESGGD